MSRRGKPDPRFDEPQGGLPDYLFEPAVNWMMELLWRDEPTSFSRVPDTDRLRLMQVALRMSAPLSWQDGGHSALRSLVERMGEDRELALDVLDFLVQTAAAADYADNLNAMLVLGGSEWEVAAVDDRRQLARRSVGPVRESIDAVRTDSQRAHHHLVQAWSQLNGRRPDPSAVYREAVKAVEAVARPIVSPHNPRATLGTVIRDIRAKPEKWGVVLEGASALDVANMADLIWKGQADRHGSDDPTVPLAVTLQEADAALHIAIALTRLFAGGHVRGV